MVPSKVKSKTVTAFILPIAVGGFLLAGCGGGDAEVSPANLPTGDSVATKPALGKPAAQEKVPDGWKTLTSQAGNYEVIMPIETENTTLDVPSELGTLKTYMVTASLASPETAFIASYVDYPAQVDSKNSEKMLDDARGGIATKGNKLISEKQIELDGFPGRELVVTAKEKGQELRMDVRIFLVNRRLYQVLVVSTGGQRAKNTDDFLDSFKMIKPVKKMVKPVKKQ